MRVHLRSERGMTLIMTVGILAVVSTMAATVITYTSSTGRSASYQRSEDVTVDLAEAGLARALSKLAAAPSAVTPTLLSSETHTFPEGTVTVSGILAGETWNITSTSSVPNPANGANLSKKLTMTVQIGIDPSSNNAWNYVYSDAPTAAGCMIMKNNVVISSPLFVKGDLCLNNNAKATGSMVKTGGYIWIDSTGASIGDPGTAPVTYVPELKTAGGCKYRSGSTSLANCTPANRVWATSVSNDPGTLVKPAVDFPYWYTNAKPGPMQNCTTGSFPTPGGHVTGFDKDTTLDRDRDKVDIMPATAYDCQVWSGPHLQGKIKWTPDDGDPDDFGDLEVIGTVFFDGDLELKSGRKAVYSGRGTIYASGKIVIDGNTQVCGVLFCDLNLWNTEQNLLVLVSGHCSDVITSCDEIDQRTWGFEIKNNAIFQGALYVVSDFEQQNNGQMQGPVIAHQLQFENNGIANKWVAIEAMTMGTPGGGRKLNIVTTGY